MRRRRRARFANHADETVAVIAPAAEEPSVLLEVITHNAEMKTNDGRKVKEKVTLSSQSAGRW